jgi:transcriptional regulator with XRE-family HTH domain
MELKSIVSENITKLRINSKLTQLELGQKISYSDKAVSKWERGEAIPDAYVLLKMSKLFGVSVDYILTEHKDSEPVPSPVSKKHTSRLVIALITVTAIFTVAALSFIIMQLSGFSYPLMFQYATVISFIVLTVMNSVWGNKKLNLVLVSALVLSIIATVYLIFIQANKNFWQILFLAIPAEVLVCLCFVLRKPKQNTSIEIPEEEIATE